MAEAPVDVSVFAEALGKFIVLCKLCEVAVLFCNFFTSKDFFLFMIWNEVVDDRPTVTMKTRCGASAGWG